MDNTIWYDSDELVPVVEMLSMGNVSKTVWCLLGNGSIVPGKYAYRPVNPSWYVNTKGEGWKQVKGNILWTQSLLPPNPPY